MKHGTMNVSPAWGASGTQGFFESDKYWFHKILAIFGMWFLFHTFVAKTTTLNKRKGNMPLGKDGVSPKQWFPNCIKVYFWKRVVLNAVSLSGPGIHNLLSRKLWQKRKKDFFVSLMSVAGTLEERKQEIRLMIRAIVAEIKAKGFKATVGVQLNISCPNVGASYNSIVLEAYALLNVIDEEDPERLLSINVKLAPTVSADDGAAIAYHHRCDGLCIGNTAPFGSLKAWIKWVKLFGTDDPTQSPLYAEFKQAGGLSGAPLLPIICDIIRKLRALGVTKHINACGGILGPISTFKVLRAGADSISIGTAPALAPWGVVPAIIMAHIYHWFRFNFNKKAWRGY